MPLLLEAVESVCLRHHQSLATVCFHQPDHKDDYEQLILLIMCDEHIDIMSIIDSEEFKAVVNDIRPE